MADGDIVHNNLAGLYQRPYQILCEGKQELKECARRLMEAIKKDIENKGSVPIVLAKQMGEWLDRAIKNAGDSSSLNWTAANKEFERLARQTNGPHRVKELALVAGKSLIHDLRYGRKLEASSLSEILIKRYMGELYRADFEKRIPLTSEHHASVDNALLEKRVKAIEPEIFEAMDQWANRANIDGDVVKLKLPPRQNIKEIDLEEDLL